MYDLGKFMVLVCVVCIISCSSPVPQELKVDESNSGPQACFKDQCFDLELAMTSTQHTIGLMFRENLQADTGMLFIFKKDDIYSFWMKNTLIPLDIIWIDANNKVAYVGADIQPCKSDPCPGYGPDKRTRYVLEINAGESIKYNISVGDTVRFMEVPGLGSQT